LKKSKRKLKEVKVEEKSSWKKLEEEGRS